MFRIVRDFVPAPAALILCDISTCGQYMSAPLPSVPDMDQAERIVIEAARKQGWAIQASQPCHICPDHVKRMQSEQPMIQLAPPGVLIH